MDKKSQIIRDFYASELKIINKELENYFKKKSNLLPLDSIFKLIIGPETETRIIKQKEFTIQMASQWNGMEDELEAIVNENFQSFLKLDAGYLQFKKRHPKFEEAKMILKDIFRHKIRNDYKLLNGEGNIYEELAISSTPNKEEALEFANIEVELYKKTINFLKDNRGIINVPGVIRIDILEAVVAFYLCVIKHLKDVIERLYSTIE